MKYRATDLYDNTNDRFFCPSCNNDLILVPFATQVKNDIAFIKCKNCGETIQIALPIITKKLIYLDQWFVSDLAEESSFILCREIILKIHRLAMMQRVYVVTSDINAKETAAISEKYSAKKKKTWDKFNSLAGGHVAKDATDVLVQQYKRLLLDEQETYQWADILDNNPHEWIAGVKVVLTNNWRLRLHEQASLNNDDVDELCRKVLEAQLDKIDHNSTCEECYEYINNLWKGEIAHGANYYEKLKENLSSPSFIDMDFLDHTGSNIYNHFIRPIIDQCRYSGTDLPEDDVINSLKSLTELPKKTAITNSLDALKLYAALQTKMRGTEITKNKKKFSVKYGASNLHDTSHISTFVPYVDILLTDNNARKNLNKSPVKEQLADVRCVIYSYNNLQHLSEELDNMLKEDDDYDVQITRKLVMG